MLQYKCAMASEAELSAADAVETRSISCDARRLLLLTVTCLAVVLLMTFACNSLGLAMTSRQHGMHASDVVSVLSMQSTLHNVIS